MAMKPADPPAPADPKSPVGPADGYPAPSPAGEGDSGGGEPDGKLGTSEYGQGSYSVWSTDLCDCFSDVRSCCLVFWCPCVAFGRIAEIVDRGSTSCCCSGSLYLLLCSLSVAGTLLLAPMPCQWIISCTYRGKLKERSNIPPSCCEECCTHFWCESCAMCQEYRELQRQGYDLSLGWEGNLQKKSSDAPAMPAMVAAPVAPSMNR